MPLPNSLCLYCFFRLKDSRKFTTKFIKNQKDTSYLINYQYSARLCSAGNIALRRTVILQTTWSFFLTWIFLGPAINCFILKVLLRTLPSMFLTLDLTRLRAACLL